MSETTDCPFGALISPANTGNSTLDDLIAKAEANGLFVTKVPEQQMYFITRTKRSGQQMRCLTLKPVEKTGVRATFSFGIGHNGFVVPDGSIDLLVDNDLVPQDFITR